MTVAEYLADHLRCPCGGELSIAWSLVGLNYCDVDCRDCGAHMLQETTIDALTAWLLLTGGPIPPDVNPPHRVPREKRAREILYESGISTQGVDWQVDNMVAAIVGWYFRADERTPEIIRPWIEQEMK